MLSIIERLGEAPFYRIRVGIGRPQPEVDPVEYVLQPFSTEEAEQLQPVLERAAESVISLLRDGPARAMACFNQAS